MTSAGAPRFAGGTGTPVQAREWAVLALIVVFGAAVRVPIALHSGLWRDEALFLGVASQPTLRDVFAFLSWHESHPPLFYLLARGWMAVVGTGDRSVTFFALVFGVGLIPVCWWVGRRLFGRGAALLAAAIVAVSQLLALYGASVRPYAFLASLTVVTTYLLWRALLEYEVRRWIAVAIATLALVYTHNWAWLVVTSHALLAMTWIAFTKGRRALRLRALVTTYAAVLIGFLPWMRVLIYQATHAGYPPVGHLLWIGVWQSTYVLLGIVPTVGAVLLALPIALSVVTRNAVRGSALLSGPTPARERHTLAMLLVVGTALVPLLLAIAASPAVNMLKPQCFATVAPCLALSLAGMPGMLASPPRRVVSVAALGAYVAMCLIVAVRAAGAVKSNAREVALLVQERARPGDVVIQYPGFITSSFNRYFHGDLSQIAFPRFGGSVLVEFDHAYQRGTGLAEFGQTLDSLDAARAGGRGVWLLYDREVRLLGARPPQDSAGTSEYYYRARHDFAVRLWQELTQRFGEPVYRAPPPRRIAFEGIGAAYFRTASPAPAVDVNRGSASPAAATAR